MDGFDIGEQVTTFQLPRKLAFLMEPHSFKVAYGGRHGMKSRAFSGALLTQGLEGVHRILCAREVQKSLVESVHQLLVDQIRRLGYGSYYSVTENAIRGDNGTLFRFTGLSDHTAESMKSFEGFDRFWGEEAQSFTKRSLQIALPTIMRMEGAEAWFSFNPEMDTDEVWQRFIVNQVPGAVVVKTGYRDAIAAGWWNDEQERLRQYDFAYSKDEYDNIWEGNPRTTVIGAIYAREVVDMMSAGRFRAIPYDPRLPVHRVWDLGWNDRMSVIMVQKPHPSAINVINYFEDSEITYAEIVQAMDNLRYRWGDDWLPHDASQHHPTSGTSARKMLASLGCRVKDIPKSDPEMRIKAARMMWPRVYMDNTQVDTPPIFKNRLVGGGHLMDRLKRYKRAVPRNTQEPAAPVHDINSHASDAWGSLAEIVERIRNDGDRILTPLPTWNNADSGMGMLG